MNTRISTGLVGVIVVAVAAGLLTTNAGGSHSVIPGKSIADLRAEALAAPTTTPKGKYPPKNVDPHRRHAIVLRVGYTPAQVGDRPPRSFKVVGYHGIPFAGAPGKIVSGNVPMSQSTLAREPEQRWESREFDASEGDVVKTAIDARGKFPTSCLIRQDGLPVVRTQVDPANLPRGGVVGVASCTWVVQLVG